MIISLENCQIFLVGAKKRLIGVLIFLVHLLYWVERKIDGSMFVWLMSCVSFCVLQLQCRARVRHISINTFTPQVLSEEFFAGIQILSPNPMQLIEGIRALSFFF